MTAPEYPDALNTDLAGDETSPPCGFAAGCGRPRGHRGHHGGWRPTILAAVADPVFWRWDDGRHRLGKALSPTELRVLGEHFHHGTRDGIARCLGMAPKTVEVHITAILAKTGAERLSGAAAALGWVRIPDGLEHGSRPA